MNEETKQEKRTWTEEIEVAAEELVNTVKELVKESNVRRVIVYRPNGEPLLNIPLPAGMIIGGVAVLSVPLLSALVALAALLGNYKLQVIRTDEGNQA